MQTKTSQSSKVENNPASTSAFKTTPAPVYTPKAASINTPTTATVLKVVDFGNLPNYANFIKDKSIFREGKLKANVIQHTTTTTKKTTNAGASNSESKKNKRNTAARPHFLSKKMKNTDMNNSSKSISKKSKSKKNNAPEQINRILFNKL